MSINKSNHETDIFDNDFEVIYEGELPDLTLPKDDNYKDVLSSLSQLDNTQSIDYLEANYTASFDLDEKPKKRHLKSSARKRKKGTSRRKFPRFIKSLFRKRKIS